MTEEKCPTCGKMFKNLARHKCKEAPKETKAKEAPKKVAKPKKTEKKSSSLLVDSDDYLSAGIHIGTKNKTSFMKGFVYKIRPDGLAIFDVQKINDRLTMLTNYLSKFKPEEILIVAKRDNATKPLKMLSLATGINVMTGRYLPGTLTNPNNEFFIEPKVVMVSDTWYDKQVVKDALKSGAVIVALCNSNTPTTNIDIVIPCNNRGHKSLALVYWVIAREYCKAHKIKFEFEKEKFI